MPWFAVLVAFVAFAFLVLPLVGLVQQVPWGNLREDLATPEATAALRLSLVCSLWATFFAVLLGVPLAWVLARVTFPGRSVVRALDAAPDGGAAGRRRRRAVLRVRARRPRRPVPLRLVRRAAHVLDRRRGHGGDVRRDAVPRHHGRGRAALGRPAVRGRRGHARRRPLRGVPPGHGAADPAGADRRAPRSRGRGRSASSAPPSPSPATSRAGRRRCRSRCTSCSSRTRRWRSG